MKNVRLVGVVCAMLVAGIMSVPAQDKDMKMEKKDMKGMMKDKMGDKMMDQKMGMTDEFATNAAANLKSVGDKLAQLAEAVPADKLDWRPEKGVRSIREVLTHAADANLMFLNMAGIKSPDGYMAPKDKMERENRYKTNAEIAKAIRESFAYAADQVSKLKHDQLHAEATMFGNKTTVMNVLLVSIGHLHEHLGQSIAYARTNGVTPPWSM